MNVRANSFKRLFPATVIFLVWVGLTDRALASGDSGCSSVWRLMHRDYEGCSNMAFLSPSNDTRVNLLLLLADLRHATATSAKYPAPGPFDAPLFPWDQLASRLEPQTVKPEITQSTPTPSPDDSFMLAVRADQTLKPVERDALLADRTKALSGYTTNAAVSAVADAEKVAATPSATAYARYLEGAVEFWRSDYDKANATFSSLTNAQPAWVREAATYMIGRSLINRAQTGAFDEYGSFKKDWHADSKTVAASEAALDKYLQQYPKGEYAQSARGLKRRGYWLADDTAKLEEEYGALLLLSPVERNVSVVELVQEIDNKVTTPTNLPDAQPTAASTVDPSKFTHSPLLLAMIDLSAMRTTDGASGNGTTHNEAVSIAELQQQRQYFAGQMPLYEFLLAVHAFYIENKPAEVLHLIPDATHQGSFGYVQFSRQVLRGMALEALKDHNALGFWMQMLPGAKAAYERPALELAIAYHDERAGEVRNVFALGSPVHDPYLREVLLANVADADLLRAQTKNANAPKRERDVALFTLLYKEATLGHAVDFLKDLPLVPPTAPVGNYFALDTYASSYSTDEYHPPPDIPLGIFLHNKTDSSFGCPGLRTSEEQLVQDRDNPTAQLCVSDFIRLNQAVTYLGSTTPSASEVGGTPSLFPGGTFVRMNAYLAVLANAKSSRNDQAYALYRAVNCYAPSGNNDCGGKDVPKAMRKAFFTKLKSDYAGTRWANALQYYW